MWHKDNTQSILLQRKTNENYGCLSNYTLFEIMVQENLEKPKQMSHKKLEDLLNPNNKLRLSKDQQLLKPVVEGAKLSRIIRKTDFKNIQEIY